MKDRRPNLSPREIQTLELVAAGIGNKEIAARQGVSEATVKNRLSQAYSKLGVNNRPAAVVKAFEYGLIELPVIK